MLPAHYLVVKAAMLREAARRGHLPRTEARTMFRLEPNRALRVYDLLTACGWLQSGGAAAAGPDFTSPLAAMAAGSRNPAAAAVGTPRLAQVAKFGAGSLTVAAAADSAAATGSGSDLTLARSPAGVGDGGYNGATGRLSDTVMKAEIGDDFSGGPAGESSHLFLKDEEGLGAEGASQIENSIAGDPFPGFSMPH